MTGSSCSIFGCINKFINGGRTSLHLFPKDPDVRSYWIKVCRRQNWIPTKSSVVCSDHFNKDDFKIMKRGQKRRWLKPGAIPSFKKRQEKLLLSSKIRPTSNTKSDSLTLTADPLLEDSVNQGPMKLQCLECRAEFDLDYDAEKKLHTLKPDSALCSHVKQGGKTAVVPNAKTEPDPGKPESKPSESDHEPSKQCLQCPASFGLEHDLKQHREFAHNENAPKSASKVANSGQNSKSKPLSENVQRVFDMNSLPTVCSLDSPEINRNHDPMVNHSKVHLALI